MKKFLKKLEERVTSRFSLTQWLVVTSLFSLSMLSIRIIKTGRSSYGFLAWNLFLAYVPYFISEWLGRHPRILTSRIKLLLLIFTWIIFMPNSFYILTDLFHLNNASKGDSWYDLTLILSFAWNGILVGILSIYTWDVFVNPLALIPEIVNIVFNPYDYRYVWAMSFCFAFFMAILYYTTKRLSDVFKNG